MALIKLGSLVTRISGKIGGQTFGTARGGSYIRNTGTTRKINSGLAQNSLAAMSQTAQAWRELSQVERGRYNTASQAYQYTNRIGETKNYSGYAIFCQLLQYAKLINLVGPPRPLPKSSFVPADITIEQPIGGQLLLQIERGQSDVYYLLFCSPPFSKGITGPYKNQYFIGGYTANPESPFNEDLTEALTEKFGTLPNGFKMYYRIDAVSRSTAQPYKNFTQGYFTV